MTNAVNDKPNLLAETEFDKVKLYRYEPFEKNAIKTAPVLITYGLIGSYTMIDLQNDRSLVRNLLSRGVDVYVIDWGYATRGDKYLSFDDYVGIYLDDCVDATCQNAELDKINLFGICEGGVFTTMYAAQHPEKVANLILSITPIDFAAYKKDNNPAHGLINLWVENIDDADIEALIDSYGNLPGEIMGGMVAAKQWLIDLYKHNKLVKGEFKVLDEVVDLNDISMPVLNLHAERDHIIPPPCSTALKDYVGSKDYTDMPIKGGHVGIYVSSRLQDIATQRIKEIDVHWLGLLESS